MLNGYKTYILALAAIGYGVGGYFSGHLDSQTALSIVWKALIVSALRHGISTRT